MSKPGDIIDIRGRLWRVDAIQSNVMTASPIGVDDSNPHRFFIPRETITPAHIPFPSFDKFGDNSANELLVRSYKYSMLHGSAPLLSLQRSGVIPTQYQLVPVIMALNETERVRMLIADDVGLGKTIEAGLIATELQSRNLATRILVVCPKNLRDQWQDALRQFFHIDAEIMSTVHRRMLERQLPPGTSPWEHYRALVTSIDYAKGKNVKHQIFDVSWDLVIVDEAHLAAKPHQTGAKQSVSMERYNFVKDLAKHTKHLLFLTATPHNGYRDSYASLLDMLGCNIVSGTIDDPTIDKERAIQHVCQRRRKDVEEWFDEHSEEDNPFPKRKQDEVLIELVNDEEVGVYKALESYGEDILTAADAIDTHKARITAHWVVMHLHKRALSSPASLRKSLKNRRASVLEKIKNEETTDDTSISPADAKANALDEDAGDELTDEDLSIRTDKTAFGTIGTLSAELNTLDHLIELADKITPAKDSKLKKLTGNDGILHRAYRGMYGPAKIIIFTRYTDTMNYLEREIPKRLKDTVSSDQIVTVYGDLNEAQRRERLNKFQNLKAGILIATDCISEGINLQHMANQMIHYELPWNPNRLEQRNGRIDRYGQQTPTVYIKTLVMQETLDAAILRVLITKARQIREDYGFAPPFFGDDTNVIDIIRNMGDAIPLTKAQKTLTEFDENEIADNPITDSMGGTCSDIINPLDESTIEQMRSDSFYGQTDIDASEIIQRLKETEQAVGSTEDFRKFILDGFKRFGANITENMDLDKTLKIALPEPLHVPNYDTVIEHATFNPKVANANTDAVHLHISHPIVRRLINTIKHATFNDQHPNYGRTSVITTSDVSKVTALYHFLVRFAVGTDPVTVVEEMVPVACNLIDGVSMDDAEISRLLSTTPVYADKPKETLLNHLKLAMNMEKYESALNTITCTRRGDIMADRATLKDRLMADGKNPQWLDGIDSVAVASSDLISLRIYEPVPATGGK